MTRKQHPNALAVALHDFFGDHLPRLRGMSPHTIRSYRDSIVLLLRFVSARQSRPVVSLDLENLGVEEILAFLDHLERERHNTASTRNVRLAALHAFFRCVAARHPEHVARCQRILAVPFKRSRSRAIEYLEFEEITAVLEAVDRSTRLGRRDYVLLALMFNTGARVQEILSLRGQDLQLSKPFQVRLFGKGRKERFCPLWPQTARILRAHCVERRLDLSSADAVFTNHRGQVLTRFGVRYILAKHLQRASAALPTLAKKRLHPHSMRHSTAVHLLKAGVDLSTISHWLGHASMDTTNKYVAIDLEMKRKALARAKVPSAGRNRRAGWRHHASTLEWLEAL